tara:strand:+ start:1043 stop:2026 length:984 start_codon:yes stop_codon:yes gene_type:complete
MNDNQVRIGVIGVGHLGQHHVKHYKTLDNVELIGVFDIDRERSSDISKKFDVKVFDDLNSILEKVDALSIVTNTEHHFKIAEKCLRSKKHVFIEKPITAAIEEADKLLSMAEQNRVLIQVGHIERLNPALLALNEYEIKPKFLEIQRLAPYTSRGTDVPVVLDKMIHDIDILLSLVKVPIKKIQATGLSILTNSIDIAHARMRFEDGTVASVMSSRIARDEVRKIKIFQRDLYATLDLLIGSTEIYEVVNDKASKYKMTIPFDYKGNTKLIGYHKPDLSKNDPLKMELENFVLSIQGKQQPIVPGKDGRDALEVAIKIQEMIILDKH